METIVIYPPFIVINTSVILLTVLALILLILIQVYRSVRRQAILFETLRAAEEGTLLHNFTDMDTMAEAD